MNIEIDYIKSLVSLATEEGLTELKVISGDKKVVIKKEKELHLASSLSSVAPVQTIASQPVTSEKTETVETTTEIKQAEPATMKKGSAINSPMVGTFYRSPSPDASPFVEVGQSIKVGQVLCIIESMKLMNEIESEVSGIVREICLENGDPVETDTVLMYIE